MKLNELFPDLTAASGQQAQNHGKQRAGSASASFDVLMAAAETRDEIKQKPRQDAPVKRQVKQKDAPVKPKEKEAISYENSQTQEAVTTDKKPAQTKAADKPAAEAKPTDNAANVNEETLNEVAKVLNIPTDALTQMLAALNMTLADLAEPQNVALLLQKVLDVPSPAVLITMPEFTELFNAVNEIMAGFEVTDAEVPYTLVPGDTAKAEALQNMRAAVNENGETQVTFTSDEQAAAAVVNEKPATATAEDDMAAVDIDGDTPQLDTEAVTQPARQGEAETQTGTQPETQGETQTGTQAETHTETQANPRQLMTQGETSAEAAETDMAVNTAVNAVSRSESAVQTSAVRASARSVVDAGDVMNQVMSRIRTAGDSFSEIRLTLKPENLGDITLRVATQNGIVTAQFVAESERVREIIEANFNQLRDVLTEQGINFSELSVSVRQEDRDAQMAQFEQGRQANRVRRQRIAEVGSEEIEEPQEELLQGNLNIRV
jgi:flagellar hook-length control protein FliK